jgi:hypothetical protein
VREVRDEQVILRDIGRPPEQVDLVYCHRPLEELPRIVAMAKELGARAVWCQFGRASDGMNDPKGCWAPGEASRKAHDPTSSDSPDRRALPAMPDLASHHVRAEGRGAPVLGRSERVAGTARVKRVFDASRERVWAEWTQPERFADWFRGVESEVPVSSVWMDVRQGGTWRATMFV